VLLAFGFIAWLTVGAHAAELLNVSYDPHARALQRPQPGLCEKWKAETGEDVTISSRMAARATGPLGHRGLDPTW